MNPYDRMTPWQPLQITATQGQRFDSLLLADLRTAAEQHNAVLLRGFAPMDRDALLAYCEAQAELLHWNFGPVMEMRAMENAANYLFTEGDVPLHWDGAFHREPRFLLFHCIEPPDADSGGETFFVDTRRMWAAATPETRAYWDTLMLSCQTEKRAHYGGEFITRLVQRHPETGEVILRFAEPVGPQYRNPVDVRVCDLESDASDACLETLSRIARSAPFCWTHTWQAGDFLIADNFALLHGRNAFTRHSPRHLRRIQIL